MVSAKLAICLCAVLFWSQAAAAAPQPKEGVDFTLIIKNIAQIVEIIFKNLDDGINNVNPILDELHNELPAEVADALINLRDGLLAIVVNVEQRLLVVIKELEDADTSLDAIAVCTDPTSERLNDIFAKFELGTLGVFRKTIANNTAGLEGIKFGVKQILDESTQFATTTFEGLSSCLVPGATNGADCVRKVVEPFIGNLVLIGTDIIAVTIGTLQVLIPFLSEIFAEVNPLLTQAVVEFDPLLQEISDCLPTLS